MKLKKELRIENRIRSFIPNVSILYRSKFGVGTLFFQKGIANENGCTPTIEKPDVYFKRLTKSKLQELKVEIENHGHAPRK